MKKTILIGGGGHALSLLETITDISQIAGYADYAPNALMPIPYLGNDDEVLARYSPEEYDIQVTLVYTTDVNLKLRKKILEKYSRYQAHSFIAQSAIVTSHAEVGDGCVLMERSIVNRSTILANTIINTGAIVEHGCTIGSNCFIGPGAVICGGVKIGDNTLIGAGAVIRDDVTISSDTVIGMGSVVTRSITESGIYAGNPFSKIK